MADLSGQNLTGAYFPRANLSYANLTAANLDYANLNGASLAYATLTNATLYSANLTGAYLYRATGGTTANVTLVTWSNTTCPDGTNSDTNVANSCVGHGF